ncbi:hypothetical protein EV11_1922 [Prochlorococcus sp. SS52]|nr:hypothetical protein EV04_1731 [Prochlorococcus marinus str. LG]KGG20118.1 hypothetical protein EV08_1144 [Prochlorococcus marinus str. SS2]KGG24017.1 hypothetical protein EV09_0621 [Prochlorococcus marinus str. SS35]KGG31724.1 hypothetical protein EV10_1821 [Prochlorococcus marinus str. SS51]KGG34790.1 hypothetical protein EV11_1922 [Prochlorococcus sp. SS52]
MLPALFQEGLLGIFLFGSDHQKLDVRSDQSGIATRAKSNKKEFKEIHIK